MTSNRERTPLEKLDLRNANVARRAKAFAQIAVGSDPATYDAIGGIKAPPRDGFLASFIGPRKKAASVIAVGLMTLMRTPGNRAFRLTIKLPDAMPLSYIELDANAVRKLRYDFRKVGILDAAGMIKLVARPAQGPDRHELGASLDLVAYGSGIGEAAFRQLDDRLKKRLNVQTQVVQFRLIDAAQSAVARAGAEPFDMSEGNAKALAELAMQLGVKGWKKRRPLRDWCRFMALASVQFQKLCFAVGDGERLIDKAVVEGKHLLKPMWRTHPPVIHRDQIGQFTAAELNRLSLAGFQLPFIKVR